MQERLHVGARVVDFVEHHDDALGVGVREAPRPGNQAVMPDKLVALEDEMAPQFGHGGFLRERHRAEGPVVLLGPEARRQGLARARGAVEQDARGARIEHLVEHVPRVERRELGHVSGLLAFGWRDCVREGRGSRVGRAGLRARCPA